MIQIKNVSGRYISQERQMSNDYAFKSLIDDLNIRDKHKSPIVLANIHMRQYFTYTQLQATLHACKINHCH